MSEEKPRIAVVLFNLGGPDAPDAVRPFLFNLFNDKAIISLPQPLRWFIARIISARRAPIAREIYDHIGGSSPLLQLSEDQAEALKIALSDDWDVEVFLSMRYWHPMSWQTAFAVKAFNPEHIIALPLYPQFSTTTTGSSFTAWRKAAKKAKLTMPASYVCCYPTDEDFITAHAQLIRPVNEAACKAATESLAPRILFSAHGLPEKIIAAGDPYQWQIERTTQAVIDALAIEDLDYVNCYQSRVGPLEWIKPSTEDEIKRAGSEGVPLVVVPIAFVSEHSETLVELDIEYRDLAEKHNVAHYMRVPALGVTEHYITSLANICRKSYTQTGVQPAEAPPRYCELNLSQCPCVTQN